MGAVVARLRGAPVPEPVPVVVDHVVLVGAARGRALPQVVVEGRRHLDELPAADGAAVVGVPAPGEVGPTDHPLAQPLHGLDGPRERAALGAHLDGPPALPRRLDEHLALAGVVECGLLQVDVLAGLQGQDRRRRVPVVGGGDHEGVDRGVVQDGADVHDALRGLLLGLERRLDALGQGPLLHVADERHLGFGLTGEDLRQGRAPAVGAHHRHDDAVARCRAPGPRPRARPGATPRPTPVTAALLTNSRRVLWPIFHLRSCGAAYGRVTGESIHWMGQALDRVS